MPTCVGVRFANGPKIHYLEAMGFEPELGSSWVVSTPRGLELAKVRSATVARERALGRVVREATAEDYAQVEKLKNRAEELKWLLKARVRQRGLAMKVVALEFTLDEAVLLVSYSSEQQQPLRQLLQDLQPHTQARIEFESVGPRDQSRMLGTLGVCGDGSCSSMFLQGFSAVSIRMARDQQLPLSPEKISGPCGRLLCCLQYEHQMYRELLAEMPKKGSRACHSESGACGRVIKLNPLKGTVDMVYDEGGFEEVAVDKVTPLRKAPHARGASAKDKPSS